MTFLLFDGRFLKLHKLEANAFMQVLLQNMQKLESCDPAVYQSVLLQALKDYRPQVLRLSNSVKKTRAEVIEPGQSNVVRQLKGQFSTLLWGVIGAGQ